MRAKTRSEDLVRVTWAKGKGFAKQRERHVCSIEGKGAGEVLKVYCSDSRPCKLGY